MSERPTAWLCRWLASSPLQRNRISLYIKDDDAGEEKEASRAGELVKACVCAFVRMGLQEAASTVSYHRPRWPPPHTTHHQHHSRHAYSQTAGEQASTPLPPPKAH